MTNFDQSQPGDIDRRIAENAAGIASLLQVVTQQQENFELMWAGVQEMQSEVRGLQVENRRILGRLEQLG